jgi:tRNA pseudouridine65 synthase
VPVIPPDGWSPQVEGSTANRPWRADDASQLRLLHRDDDLIVIDKPPGLLVHRSRLDAHEHDTVMSRLWRELGSTAPAGLTPVHRLDKGTSGLLVLACHAEAARWLSASFEQGSVRKRYLALVRGWPAEHVAVDHALARDPELPSTGQVLLPAQTQFHRLGRVEWAFSVDGRHAGSRYALVAAEPTTGRRHQIRRHLKHAAHPLIGDATHGKGAHNRAVARHLRRDRLWLHAVAIDLPLRDGKHRLVVRAEPGTDWAALLAAGPWLDAPVLDPAGWPDA